MNSKRDIKLWLILITIIFSFSLNRVVAQGDGPRSYLLAPKGVTGISAKWLNLNQNLLPGSNILIESADLEVNIFPTTFFHNFRIKNRFAQVQFMLNPGNVKGSLISNQDLPFDNISADGFSDGFVGFKYGLIGAPALNILEFSKQEPQISMFVYSRLWFSGSYDKNKPINLGTNRITFDIGFPMTLPIGKKLERPIWLEIFPSIQIYGKNTNPTVITFADESLQKPTFTLANQLTHNFTKNFWGGIGTRFQIGGALELDGVNQDNRLAYMAGGVSAGYQILPFISGNASYGTILFGDNGVKSDMFRLGLVFVYANTKNIKNE